MTWYSSLSSWTWAPGFHSARFNMVTFSRQAVRSRLRTSFPGAVPEAWHDIKESGWSLQSRLCSCINSYMRAVFDITQKLSPQGSDSKINKHRRQLMRLKGRWKALARCMARWRPRSSSCMVECERRCKSHGAGLEARGETSTMAQAPLPLSGPGAAPCLHQKAGQFSNPTLCRRAH